MWLGRAEAHVLDLVSLIRFLSDGLATSPDINILVLKATITQLGGICESNDLTGKDIPGGGTGIDAGLGCKVCSHGGGV